MKRLGVSEVKINYRINKIILIIFNNRLMLLFAILIPINRISRRNLRVKKYLLLKIICYKVHNRNKCPKRNKMKSIN
jgi:hypothetical protein